MTESNSELPRERGDKGQRERLEWWVCTLTWLQWWFHGWTRVSKLIKLHTLKMCSSLFINYTSIKLSCLNVTASGQEGLDVPTSLKQLEELANYIRQWLRHTGRDSVQHRRGTEREETKAVGRGCARSPGGKLPGLSTDSQKPDEARGRSEVRRQSLQFREASDQNWWERGEEKGEAQGPAGASFQGFGSVLPRGMQVSKGKGLLGEGGWNNPWSSPRAEKNSHSHQPARMSHLIVAYQAEFSEADSLHMGPNEPETKGCSGLALPRLKSKPQERSHGFQVTHHVPGQSPKILKGRKNSVPNNIKFIPTVNQSKNTKHEKEKKENIT